MSSKYAEKKHQAACRAPGCDETGTHLAVLAGAVNWFCDACYGQIQAEKETR